MPLGTVGADGRPDARTVLLTAFDETGRAFHTSAGSREVAELAALPRASMVVLWPGSTRQLVLRGDVVPDGEASLAAAWSARSDHLRRLARLNTDELAALARAERLRGWGAPLAGPGPADSWVGYRLRPREVTFWGAGHACPAGGCTTPGTATAGPGDTSPAEDRPPAVCRAGAPGSGARLRVRPAASRGGRGPRVCS